MTTKTFAKTGSVLMIALIFLLGLTGCGSDFGIVINEDLNVEITAEKAAMDSSGSAGTFTVGENDTVIIEPDLETGSIQVQFTPFGAGSDENADLEELTAQAEPAFETDVSGTDPAECRLAAGDYMVAATVTEKANGTVIIRTGESLVVDGGNTIQE